MAGLVQFTAQVDLAAGNTGHDRANGEIQSFGDFLIGQSIKIEHNDGGFQPVVQFIQNRAEVAGHLPFQMFFFQIG